MTASNTLPNPKVIIGYIKQGIKSIGSFLLHPTTLTLLLTVAGIYGATISLSTYKLNDFTIPLIVIQCICIVISIFITICESDIDVKRFFQKAMLGIAITTLPFIYIFAVFSCNWSWLERKDMSLIIDGIPIVHDKPIFLNPLAHDIQNIPLSFDVDGLHVTGITKDGVFVAAKLNIKLRRSDNPLNWKSHDRLATPLESIAADLFKKACAEIDTTKSGSLTPLELELLIVKNNQLENALPAAVQRNGEVLVWDLHPFQN